MRDNTTTIKRNRAAVLLVGSIAAFIYFSILVVDSYQSLGMPSAFRFFGELLTIPMLVLTVVCLLVSGYRIFKRDNDLKAWITFGLSLLIIAVLAVVTVIQT